MSGHQSVVVGLLAMMLGGASLAVSQEVLGPVVDRPRLEEKEIPWVHWSWCMDTDRESIYRWRGIPLASAENPDLVSLLRATPSTTGATVLVTIWLKKDSKRWTKKRVGKCNLLLGRQKPIIIRRLKPRSVSPGNPYKFIKSNRIV